MASEVAQIVALVCVAALGVNEAAFSKHHPTMLVENIRRQLMNGNYDYMPSESEETFPIKHELSNEANTTTSAPATPGDRQDRAIDLGSDINDQFISRTNDLESKDDFDDNSHKIAKNDLLYYLDDDRLKHDEKDVVKAMDGTTTTVITVADSTTVTVVESTSPKLKYKVLKVRDPHPSRRSQTFRRFIQEEGEEGVAIINLHDGPFPEFRLPRARRQYMMDQQDYDSELELAPPSEEG